MSLHVVTAVGEYLGRLPFHDTTRTDEFASVFMAGGRLIAVEDDQSSLLQFCQNIRALDEVDQFLADNGIAKSCFTEMTTQGILATGPAETAFSWLGDCTLVPAGRSLGFTDDGLLLLSPQDDVLQVSPAYYWLWTYSRTGRSLAAVYRFLTGDAAIGDAAAASVEELSQAVMHMLSYNMGRLDRPRPAE
ncbi:hypothetical protein C6V83_16755 [Gordonia iterans]|uniref:Uncharacterized protein n=1 Tax=Gordonia iterans TaxID=1004901 RepID=A0A2S0KJ23_9ACTN|nr:hypothetical protein [Gordonia iterans]AVM01663.1 hypothetical protein C6V83_16755 [Gordonia iterans]